MKHAHDQNALFGQTKIDEVPHLAHPEPIGRQVIEAARAQPPSMLITDGGVQSGDIMVGLFFAPFVSAEAPNLSEIGLRPFGPDYAARDLWRSWIAAMISSKLRGLIPLASPSSSNARSLSTASCRSRTRSRT